ncbi:MAG TPA: bifunctional lysylphosphatidylglycerol flippase/synthetase MprF [Longimicrobiales bacterium]
MSDRQLDDAPLPDTGQRAWFRAVTILLAVVAAIVVVHQELAAHSYREILRALNDIPMRFRLLALLFTAAGYAVLTIYDFLALRYARVQLSFSRTAFASFIAFAFSNTLGWPVVTGGAVRYRLFTGWGISASETARAIAFSTATFWVGVVTVAGLGMVLEPRALATMLRSQEWVPSTVGAVLLAGVLVYVVGSKVFGAELKLGRLRVGLPEPRLAAAQLLVSSADWLLATAVLYAFLPADVRVTILATAAAYVIAQAIGVISHVPGGIGVFEAALLILLSQHEPSTAVVAALVAYRIIYYVVPFFVATALLLVYEGVQRKDGILQVARVAGVWVPAAIPNALAIATFIAGTVLLVSGATPRVTGRLAWLTHVIPLGIIELSHFAGSLIGIGLILLAWGVQRRLNVAFHFVVLLIALGIPASLLKGIDYEEATLLVVLLLIMLPARRHFYRQASLTAEVMTPGWIVAIVGVLVAVTWLGFFSYKHVAYRDDIWWRFALRGDAPRFLRATVGVMAVTAVFAVRRLIRPARPEPDPPTPDDVNHAARIARLSEDSAAALALLGDKRLLFHENDRGFLMYGVAGRSWVALHDPIGDRETQRELAWRFRELVDKHGGWTVFYEITRERLDLYLDLGLTLLKLGEEARVDLAAFDLQKPGKPKKLRQTKRNVEKEGFTFDVVLPDAVPHYLPVLRAVSDDWLEKKNTREKSFSLGRFSDDYISNFPVALVRRDREIVAFANVWEGANSSELTVDLMRYNSSAPTSVMEYLFICMMLWAKEQGFREFNLGMAPLAGFENRTLAPLWTRAGAFVYRYGEHFYNFRGLRDYKSKFDPVWVPRYIATPGGIVLPAVLANVASLISGGYKGIITK